jgi:hypothetical protein
MATRKRGTRGFAAPLAAGLGLVTGALAALATQHRSLNSLRVRLAHLEEQVAHSQRDTNLANQQREPFRVR